MIEPEVELMAEGFEVDGLGDAGVAAGLDNALMIGDHGMSGDGDDGNVAKRLEISDPACEGEAVLAAELDIEKNGVRRTGFDLGVTLLEIFGVDGFKAFGFEPVAEKLAIGLVVLDDENAAFHDFSARTAGTVRRNWSMRVSCQGCCFWRSKTVLVRM